jgi:hypothetical protein
VENGASDSNACSSAAVKPDQKRVSNFSILLASPQTSKANAPVCHQIIVDFEVFCTRKLRLENWCETALQKWPNFEIGMFFAKGV